MQPWCWSAAHGADPNKCQRDFAFQTYLTATPAPTSAPQANLTPPPTSSASAKEDESGDPAIPLIVACFAAAAAFVTMRRYGLGRR